MRHAVGSCHKYALILFLFVKKQNIVYCRVAGHVENLTAAYVHILKQMGEFSLLELIVPIKKRMKENEGEIGHRDMKRV